MYIAFDIGEKRIGVATADPAVKVSWPLRTITVGASVKEVLAALINESNPTDIVVGRPLNQSGEPTSQTKRIEEFVQENLQHLGLPIHWQEESLTSVLAEDRLKLRKQPYKKEDIDAEAATIILQDYLESN